MSNTVAVDSDQVDPIVSIRFADFREIFPSRFVKHGQLSRTDRLLRQTSSHPSQLYFHEGKLVAVQDDQIQFACPTLISARNDRAAFSPQVLGSSVLGRTTFCPAVNSQF